MESRFYSTLYACQQFGSMVAVLGVGEYTWWHLICSWTKVFQVSGKTQSQSRFSEDVETTKALGLPPKIP